MSKLIPMIGIIAALLACDDTLSEFTGTGDTPAAVGIGGPTFGRGDHDGYPIVSSDCTVGDEELGRPAYFSERECLTPKIINRCWEFEDRRFVTIDFTTLPDDNPRYGMPAGCGACECR